MRRFFHGLFNAAGYLAGGFMILTLLAVLSSIIGRIIPALELPGADAYAGYAMACAAFLALAATLSRGEHIRVTLVMNRLSTKWRFRLDVFCHLIALAMSGALAWFSIRLVLQSLAFNDISMGIDATPLWIPQIGMAVGTSLFALAFAVELADLLRGTKRPADALTSEPMHSE